MVKNVSERVERLRERCSSIAKYYDIGLTTSENKKEFTDIIWTKKKTRDSRSTLTGIYVIESSHINLTASEIWHIYTTLTQVKYLFHCLKTDSGVRPVHHQLSRRTEGHLFVSVLAYHLLICIETTLN